MKELGRLIVDGIGTEKSVYAEGYETVVPEENIIVFPDKKTLSVDWRLNFEKMKLIAESWKEVYPYQDEAEVNVTELAEYPHLPFLVYWGSDWHIGNVDTEYDTLREHIGMIENTPNTGLVTMGDDIDNAILPKFEVRFMQTLPPYVQAFTVRDLIEELNGRNPRERQLVLGHVIGNHTHTLMEQSGYLFEEFYANSKAPIFPNIGRMFLNHGEQEYEIGLVHKYWGKSKLNPTLVGKRLMEYAYPDADVLVCGHTHDAGFESLTRGGKERIIFKAGTYRLGTGLFEKARGYGGGQLGGTCALFYPNERKIQPFRYLEDGVSYLNTLIELNNMQAVG